MARKPNFNTLINNFLKNPNNLLFLGGAVVAGYFLYTKLAAAPKSPPAPQLNPNITKTQMATDDGSTWTYGNVSNDDIAPGGGPQFAHGVQHNQSILDSGFRHQGGEQIHSPDTDDEVVDAYTDDEVSNSYMGTASPSHDYVSSVVPSNSSGPIADFDTNNEVVEVVDYSP